jgi:hypothetical protein
MNSFNLETVNKMKKSVAGLLTFATVLAASSAFAHGFERTAFRGGNSVYHAKCAMIDSTGLRDEGEMTVDAGGNGFIMLSTGNARALVQFRDAGIGSVNFKLEVADVPVDGGMKAEQLPTLFRSVVKSVKGRFSSGLTAEVRCELEGNSYRD